ncbi:MAG: GAF domain-containing protein, partial [Cyclobacteriaceae bacterium]|nr:GAF domain-containing protein [Cyclobacteriaceae bacterium]
MKKFNVLQINLILGLVSALLICLVTYVERNTITTYEKNKPYLIMAEYLKNLSTKAHLWFEEAMADDLTVSIEKDVYALLRTCEQAISSAKSGGTTPIGAFITPDDPMVLLLLEKSQLQIKKLHKSAEDRWRFKQSRHSVVSDSTQKSVDMEQAGGKLDQEFDTAYENLQKTLDDLGQHINKKEQQDAGFLNKLSWISIILVTLILVSFCFSINRMLRTNTTLVKEVNAQLTEEGQRVKTLTSFLEKISHGVYDIQLDNNNDLNNRLLVVRDKLRDSALEDDQRNWMSTGLAEIGSLLRANHKSSAELYDQVLRFIIKYTNTNQGALFITSGHELNDLHLSLVACYAFDRTKYLTKRIETGEGMVGQCFAEGETIYLKEIPQEYVNITSGLGGAKPSTLLLVPLKINNEIVGVLEMASFKDFNGHAIELIQKFAESIASTVSAV